MERDLVTPGGIEVPRSAMAWSFSRGTGPGGQGVNTSDSRVELVVDLTALVAPDRVAERIRAKLGDTVRIVAATERSQLRNREAVLERLAARLDAAARQARPRTPTRRTRSSVRRRLEAKRRRSQIKDNRRRASPEDPPG